ncbi:hypothetical protein MtrunA17_Chr3g0121601 [Medicago truncatula]|uniref:Uncharacterized protein n=1 Tax=Medicago truncatula TaxID=3880 RepID=A0A396IUQ3_MEDTR|nr:hypothetical protein MtrunA17_Chr3g0121601 [Medicago truncatula]
MGEFDESFIWKNIGWRESWSKRKGFGADWTQKYEDWETKYISHKSEVWHGPCWPWHGRATLQMPFAAFALTPSYSILAHNLPRNILGIYLLRF